LMISCMMWRELRVLTVTLFPVSAGRAVPPHELAFDEGLALPIPRALEHPPHVLPHFLFRHPGRAQERPRRVPVLFEAAIATELMHDEERSSEEGLLLDAPVVLSMAVDLDMRPGRRKELGWWTGEGTLRRVADDVHRFPFGAIVTEAFSKEL